MRMQLSKVSIITPSYNSSKHIKDTIESVLAQTYHNWEMLITDDCSTDDTVKIVRDYEKKDSRIRLFVLTQNSGAGVARNNSIKQATGKYIAYLDSDDRWLPNKLEKQVKFMEENDYPISYSSYMTCDEEGNDVGIIVCRRKETFGSILRDDKMGFLTMMYDTDKCGKKEIPLMRKRQDWGHKIDLMKDGLVAYGIKQPLAIYRLAKNSISRNKKSLIKYNVSIYRAVLGWSAIRSYLFFYLVFMPSHFVKLLRVWYINR